MNWLIAISLLSAIYFIRQSSSKRFSKSIPYNPQISYRHHRYRYSQPRQIPVFQPPERKTFHQDSSPPPQIHQDANAHGWGWDQEMSDDLVKAKEIVKFINQFLGVMGPFLFPLPYVLALIPFALPAIPLSLWLEARESSHHPPGEHGGHPPTQATTTEHVPLTSTTTLKPTTTTSRSTTSSTTRRPPTTLETTTTPTLPTTTDNTMFITFPPFQTTNAPSTNSNNSGSGGGVTSNPNTGGNSSFNQTMLGNNSLPEFENFNPVTLFPFTLFLNSSFLGDDYED